MSYSRWSNSRFYTYYLAEDTWHKDGQRFDISGVACFCYADLKNDIEGCLKKVRGIDPEATETQIEELRGYMKSFMYDVETDEEVTYYEELKNLDRSHLSKIKKILSTTRNSYNRRSDPQFSEAVMLLEAPVEMVPTFVGTVKTELGLIVLEKLLKK